MMTSKERAALRSQANGLECVFWLGKDGISENFASQIVDIFRTRELIKISVQETAPESPKELAAKIAELTDSEVVQVLGRKITLYRYNEELHKPKIKKPVKVKVTERTIGKPKRSGRAIGYGNAKSRWKNKGKEKY